MRKAKRSSRRWAYQLDLGKECWEGEDQLKMLHPIEGWRDLSRDAVDFIFGAVEWTQPTIIHRKLIHN